MDNVYDEHNCCPSCGYSWCEYLQRCIRPWMEDCESHRRLTKLQDFNINELMLFIVGVLGALGGLCVILQKSKCKTLDICCVKCVRDTDLILKEEKLEKGLPTTPQVKEEKKNLNLEFKEPEVED